MEKNIPSGGTAMLLLKLLEERDMYGYQMVETLRQRSDHTFDLKAGTLYPLLHTLEEKGFVTSYLEGTDTPRPRKYYRLTSTGKGQLVEKVEEWRRYTAAVEKVLKGGETFA